MTSYPYLSDMVNAWFGTNLNIPVAMFGTFVVIALLVATVIAKLEFLRHEQVGLMPRLVKSTHGMVPPHTLLSDLIVVCAFFGIVGARIFHILDYPTEFLRDPLSMVFSRGGFSIYGGLAFGITAGIIFLRKRSVPIAVSLDAVAPAMILGYGIGRLGCQISGDGDWGIPADLSLMPTLVPDWLWAQTYEVNILGVVISEPGVYPTPIYEFGMATLIFVILWMIRKQTRNPGGLFSIYLILSGFERLLIEKIRINKEYLILDYNFTQAEIISTLVIMAGLVGILITTNSKLIGKIGFSFIVLGALTACASI